MGDVVVVKTAEHMQNGIRFADIGEKFIAEALTLGGTLHQTCDVDNLHRGGHHGAWIAKFHKTGKSVVGYGYHAHIGLYCAEWKICRLRFRIAQAIEKSGLSHIGQAHDSTF